MTIELHINGVLNRVWKIDDIREGCTEVGGKRWDYKVSTTINILKQEVYEILEFNEYKFFVVYQSAVSAHEISWDDMLLFERQAQHKRNGKIVKNISDAKTNS